MPEDLKLSQIGSSLLPPPFRGLHFPGVRKHCEIISLRLLFPEIVYYNNNVIFCVLFLQIRAHIHYKAKNETQSKRTPLHTLKQQLSGQKWTGKQHS